MQGSVNVPLFRGVQGNTAFDNVKKLVMAGFAMRATGERSARQLSCPHPSPPLIVLDTRSEWSYSLWLVRRTEPRLSEGCPRGCAQK
jgi:hypothetical protein